MELVILAAGMGSRFGGLKQIEPIDKNNNFIIDYSIYDAIKHGFNKIVFIIKEENLELFRSTVGKRIEGKVAVEYVFQKGLSINPNRQKPWGTAHAILSCKDAVKENFAIINADDFYGEDAFRVVSDFLRKTDREKTNFGLVGYQAINTLTENGATKRGVCSHKDNKLTGLVESSLEIKNGKIYATPLNSNATREIEPNTIVSMNMLAFTPKLFDYLTKDFSVFLEENKNNLDKCEYLIPEVLGDMVKKGLATCDIIETSAVWQGVTYKEDKEKVVYEIQKLVDNGVYPENLWRKWWENLKL